jgi:ABC-type sugar transport system ATPase subunit
MTVTDTGRGDGDGDGAAAGPAVECVGLSKRYGAVQALDQADLRINVGEVVGLVGQNGAGKSTLVNILCGVVTPDEGTVAIHGKPAATGHPRAMADAGIAVVSQEQSLVEQLTVWENVYLGRELTDPHSGLLRRAQMKAGAAALFERLDIGGPAVRHPAAGRDRPRDPPERRQGGRHPGARRADQRAQPA